MRTYEGVKYKGHDITALAVEWFKMSNDDFFEAYGFNFNPHDYPGLYEKAQKIVYPDAGRYAT